GCLYGGRNSFTCAESGSSTSLVMCETKKPSWQTICGSTTPGSSPMRYAIRWLSKASCASHDQPMSQPMSRVDSASVCSDPKSPGGSSVRSAIIICTGMRLPEIGEYSSYANCTPTPELPVNTRAPLDAAPCAMLNCECSLSATMYSASSSPFATICASAIIVAVYGRIGYAVMTSTSAYFAACAAATQPLIRTVLFLLSITVAMFSTPA